VFASVVVMLVMSRYNHGADMGGKSGDKSVMRLSHQYVALHGELDYPGIYPIGANVMADSVIKLAMAPGRLNSVDISSFAAMPVINGDLLKVEVKNGVVNVTKDLMPVSERLLMKIPLDISKMSEADFQLLPGIGVAIAHRIVEYRQNNGGKLRVEELANIEGIGDKKFKMLSNYFK